MSQESDPNTEVERVDLQSLDVAEQRRQELLRLFPEVRTEAGKIDFDRLKLTVGATVDAGKERYGLQPDHEREGATPVDHPVGKRILQEIDKFRKLKSLRRMTCECRTLATWPLAWVDSIIKVSRTGIWRSMRERPLKKCWIRGKTSVGGAVESCRTVRLPGLGTRKAWFRWPWR